MQNTGAKMSKMQSSPGASKSPGRQASNQSKQTGVNKEVHTPVKQNEVKTSKAKSVGIPQMHNKPGKTQGKSPRMVMGISKSPKVKSPKRRRLNFEEINSVSLDADEGDAFLNEALNDSTIVHQPLMIVCLKMIVKNLILIWTNQIYLRRKYQIFQT